MTSWEIDVSGAHKEFTITATRHEGARILISGRTGRGDELTYSIGLRPDTSGGGLTVGPDDVMLHGPDREMTDGRTEGEAMRIAYSSDVPPVVKDQFMQYRTQNRLQLLDSLN